MQSTFLSPNSVYKYLITAWVKFLKYIFHLNEIAIDLRMVTKCLINCMKYKLESKQANIKVMTFGLRENFFLSFYVGNIQNIGKFYWCQSQSIKISSKNDNFLKKFYYYRYLDRQTCKPQKLHRFSLTVIPLKY